MHRRGQEAGRGLGYKTQDQATLAVLSDRADTTGLGAEVAGYRVQKSAGKLQLAGDIFHKVEGGMALPKGSAGSLVQGSLRQDDRRRHLPEHLQEVGTRKRNAASNFAGLMMETWSGADAAALRQARSADAPCGAAPPMPEPRDIPLLTGLALDHHRPRPRGGHDGGRLVFEGTPADLIAARCTSPASTSRPTSAPDPRPSRTR